MRKQKYHLTTCICTSVIGSLLLSGCATEITELQSTPSPIVATLTPPTEKSVTTAKHLNLKNRSLEQTAKPLSTISKSSISLSDILTRALIYHPSIQSSSFERRAREAEVIQASRRPNPELGTELENFAGNGAFSAFEGSETTFAIGQLIELGDKRRLRTNEALEKARIAGFDFEAKRLEIYTDTAKRYYAVLAAEQELTASQDLLSSAQRLQNVVYARVRAGKVSILEEQRTSLITGRARLARIQAEVRNRTARQSLASIIGVNADQIKSLSGNLKGVISPPSEVKIRNYLKANPKLARGAAEVKRRRASLKLEQAQRIPDVTLNGGVRFDQQSNDRAFIASISLPIPINDRNKGAIAAAQSRVNQGIFDQKTQELTLNEALSTAYSELQLAIRQTGAFEKQLLPAANKNFKDTQRAYEQGSVDLVILIDAQQSLFELKLEAVRAAAQYHVARIDVEGLLGRSLASLSKLR